MEERENKVYEVLEKLEIPYRSYTHPAVYTIAEIDEHITEGNIYHCKNLLLRNSKGDKHYLVITESHKSTNTRALAKQINSTRLSFASEERLNKYLGLEPGAVSPFGLINDVNKEVEVILDQDLQRKKKITFHPNVNTASVTLSYEDFVKYLNWCGNPYSYIVIPE